MKLVFLASDIFFGLFLSGIACFLWWAFTKEYYRNAFRQIARKKAAIVCLVIIVLYCGIAITDSFHYKKALLNSSGEIRLDNEGNRVYGEMHSLLDVIVAGLYSGIEFKDDLNVNVEDSYSAPFAALSFDMEQNLKTGEWDYIALQQPDKHFLGTDKAGGDVFYKLLKGIRTALIVGLVTTMIVIPFAVFFGVTAGYFGGRIDDAIQFIYITLGSIPSILLISAMMLIVNAKFQTGISGDIFVKDDRIVLFLCGILGLVGWSSLCRLLRAETIKLRELDYVKAAQALGEYDFKIIGKHIIPNLIHVILISSILRFSGLVMVEAILAYIKIGVPSTMQSWGRIVDGAREQLAREPVIWWPVVGAFIFMFILVLAINILGDAVRDALDPKLRT